MRNFYILTKGEMGIKFRHLERDLRMMIKETTSTFLRGEYNHSLSRLPKIKSTIRSGLGFSAIPSSHEIDGQTIQPIEELYKAQSLVNAYDGFRGVGI